MKILLISTLCVLLLVFYFVPAFQGKIEISSHISLGVFKLRIYGIIATLGILVSYAVARRLAPSFSIAKEELEQALPSLVIFGFIGARIYYVVFAWSYFGQHLLEIVQVWHGGLSIYGGIFGGLLGATIYAKRRAMNAVNFLDLSALVMPLGQALGRVANFFNQEAFGAPTSLPWRMYVSLQYRPIEYMNQDFFHPTFLYEALWNVAVFSILLFISSRNKNCHPGYLLGVYFVLYSLGRFFIEGLRLDSFFIHSFRVDQVTALVSIVLGAAIIYSVYENKSLANI